jgi:hypothetical protein
MACGVAGVPYGECMKDDSKMKELLNTVETHVTQFDPSAALDERFVSLLDTVAYGSYKGAESFNDDVVFRTNLAKQLLAKIFPSPETMVEVDALQKAVLICIALGDSSEKDEQSLLKEYKINEKVAFEPDVKGALVKTYFSMKEVTDSICLITLIWGYLYSIKAVQTRYE